VLAQHVRDGIRHFHSAVVVSGAHSRERWCTRISFQLLNLALEKRDYGLELLHLVLQITQIGFGIREHASVLFDCRGHARIVAD